MTNACSDVSVAMTEQGIGQWLNFLQGYNKEDSTVS
jgi:hypothetical protein